MPKLTPKQERFVQEYLVDLNATQAAIRAGYSAKTAREQASRLLSNVNVMEAVADGKAARTQRLEITQDQVLQWHIDQYRINAKTYGKPSSMANAGLKSTTMQDCRCRNR